MSTKSSQHPNSRGAGQVPFQARKKVMLVTVVILLGGALIWTYMYTRVAGNAPIAGGLAPIPAVTSPATH
jgi:hypothetical protein